MTASLQLGRLLARLPDIYLCEILAFLNEVGDWAVRSGTTSHSVPAGGEVQPRLSTEAANWTMADFYEVWRRNIDRNNFVAFHGKTPGVFSLQSCHSGRDA